jgi:4-amino-4-deoxy-L-arabinose transferase-like glycosyltransferase
MMRAPRTTAPENVDPTAVSPSGPLRAFKQAGLLLLAAAWVALGLAGHDPWKADDATSFGLSWDMALQGDYLVPHLGGEPYLVRPPLLAWAGALCIKLLSPALEPFNAARLVAGALLVLLLLFTALASRELAGRAFRWPPVLLLIGSVGLWERAHVVSPELGVAVGVAIALYGFALALRRPIAGGVALGVGVAIAFLCRGLLGPLWIVLSAAIFCALGPAWRTRAYAVTVACAFIVAAALIAPWPIALALSYPDALAQWWSGETAGQYVAILGAGKGDILFFLRNLLWFALPALPLVVWTLWTRGRGFNGGMRDPAVVVPGVLALVMLASLLMMAEPRLIYAVPLLIPLVLLASLEIDTLQRGFSAALDWFGILTFGLLAVVVWGIWIDARLHGMSAQVAALFRDTEVGFQPTFHLGFVLSAVAMTALWVVLVRPARRSNRRTVLNWAAGVTLVWCLYSTIWLGYLDSRRTYRHVVEESAVALPPSGCVASRNLGEPQRALWYYFAGVATQREELHPDNGCAVLLVQYPHYEGVLPEIPGWWIAWDGHRRGDNTERYVIYRKAIP